MDIIIQAGLARPPFKKKKKKLPEGRERGIGATARPASKKKVVRNSLTLTDKPAVFVFFFVHHEGRVFPITHQVWKKKKSPNLPDSTYIEKKFFPNGIILATYFFGSLNQKKKNTGGVWPFFFLFDITS